MRIKSSTKTSSRWVTLTPGLVAPAHPISATWADNPDYDIELKIVAVPAEGNRTGRFECQEMTVRQRDGGPPVTSAAIRSVPVAEITKIAGSGHVMSHEGTSEDGTTTLAARMLPKGVADNGPTDEALDWVAYLYRLALVTGEGPTKAMGEQLGLAPSTAGRWVALARKKGFLGESEGPGKAGG